MSKKRSQNKNVQLPIWEIAFAYLRDAESVLLPQHASFIQGLIRARDVERLAELPDTLGYQYNEPGAARIIAQLSAFFKKNVDYAEETRCTRAAIESFTRAEELCRETNDRLFAFYKREPKIAPSDPDFRKVVLVERMRKHLTDLFGERDVFLNSLPKGVKVTTGATRRLPRSLAWPINKVSKRSEGTVGSVLLFNALLQSLGLKQWPLRVVEDNRLVFVPKSYKTHRTIAAEPEVSVAFQLSIDRYLKSRLLRHGIDLKHQSRNQELARYGSITGTLATVDLSMASDTMALELIPFLLEEQWVTLLSSLRCAKYSAPWGSGVYHKFSSMGNGFTFPLETAIFWAAAKAVRSKTVSVYGDDIICDSDKYQELVDLLAFLGFSPNREKSFHVGPFRESCGADYFGGVNIRPFFIKKSERLNKTDLCHNINGLSAIAGENLQRVLIQLVRDHRLPFVPWNENTRSGIFVDEQLLYERKLIKLRGWVAYFHGYKETTKLRTKADVRAYILWHVLKQTISEPLVTSEIALGHKIRFAPMRWRIPSQQKPSHIYMWTRALRIAGL